IQQEADADGMRLTLPSEGSSTVQLTGQLAGQGAVLPASCQAELDAAAARSDNALILNTGTLDCRVVVSGRTYGFYYSNGSLSTYGNLNIRGLTLQFEKNVAYTASSRSSTGTTQDFAALSVESFGADGGDFIARADFVTASADKFPDNVMSVVAARHVKLLRNGAAFTLPAYAGGEFMTSSGSRLFAQAIADSFCTVVPSVAATAQCSD